jgi:hypothetical protein
MSTLENADQNLKLENGALKVLRDQLNDKLA